MPLLFWIVPYLIAGGVMWFVAHLMAPIGREIPLSQAILAVFLMAVCGVASSMYLKPLIGHWRILAEFTAHAVIVVAVMQFSFSRSIIAVLVYWVVMVVATVIITLLGRPPTGSPSATVLTKPVERTISQPYVFVGDGLSIAGWHAGPSDGLAGFWIVREDYFIEDDV